MSRNDQGQFESGSELGNEYADILEKYKRFARNTYDRERSFDARKRGVRYWLGFLEEVGIAVDEATEGTVHEYIESILDLADTTISSRLHSVTMLYLYLENKPQYDIEELPTAEITEEELDRRYQIKPQTAEYVKILHEEGRGDLKALSKERIGAIFPHMGDPPVRNELIARLAWQTALRMDELSRVKVDNIDRDKRMIKVRSSKLNPDDHPKLYNRQVFYDESLDGLMNEWIDKRRHALSPYADDSDYLFLSHQSEQLNSSYLSRLIKEGAHRADEEGDYEFEVQEPLTEDANGDVKQWLLTGHRVRHSRISHLANETDMPLNSLRMMAGHAKLSTTQSYITTSWETVRNHFEEALR